MRKATDGRKEKMKEAYFKLDGEFGAIIPMPDGSVEVILGPSISIADCMQSGLQIDFSELPQSFQNSIKSIKNQFE